MSENPYQAPSEEENGRETIRTWRRVIVEWLVVLALVATLTAIIYRESGRD